MYDVQYYKTLFERYGGMMRTSQLTEENVFGRNPLHGYSPPLLWIQ